MESNGVKAGMLGLEMPLHSLHQQNHPSSHNFNSNPHQQQYSNQQHQQMVSFTAHDTNHNTHPPQYVKSTYPTCTTKAKQPQQQQMAFSDEDEPGCTADDGSGDGRKRGSPWHRVKWTDNMVRLLIMVVFYIGDDACPEGNETQGMSKKKSGAMLQKKGKWKSVSKAMMEKGFSVSPQQCEDKFNDLNKRYKRVNDILGKGTAWRCVLIIIVVELLVPISPVKGQ
ncbi:hypothetical protein IFM89_006083 [Coptis chinensis]|uniref:Myb/SANT-like DNA-binding domain-containing protein n=1 Tax=Coptis chinensis TaxID=261450 RepID=A0A835H4R3_9MAGN|nr:hypothetical protein IFM89_006083 [Coptis chinensis]